jgi:hypothetical protein
MSLIDKPIIGLAGKARTGKNTVARMIIERKGGYEYALASPICRMLAQIGIDPHDEYWASHKEDKIPVLGKSPRELMQTLGTDWGRKLVSPRLWTILAFKEFQESGPGMIVTDIRFEDEARFVREHSGVIIHIERDGAPKVREHVSEAGIKRQPGDFLLLNNGTLDDLVIAVEELMNE